MRDIARMWHSSPPAVLMDVAVLSGSKRYYDQTKHPVDVQNMRAKRLGAEGKIDRSKWDDKLSLAGYKCVNCGSEADIVIDHIIPLSKGGTNTIDNIQPLCRSCNSSKRDRDEVPSSVNNGKPGWRPRKTTQA